jgi:hypothetical protein
MSVHLAAGRSGSVPAPLVGRQRRCSAGGAKPTAKITTVNAEEYLEGAARRLHDDGSQVSRVQLPGGTAWSATSRSSG